MLSFARANDMLLLSSGVDRHSSERILGLAREHPDVVQAFVGIHPSEAGKGLDLSWLQSALKDASGAGEIGLDPKYSSLGTESPQMKAFEAQLAAAEKAGKPVQVHSRDAERACLDVLSSIRLKSVLMHWFQGEELVGVIRDRGYFVSFGPALIYSKKLQRIASSSDPRLVLSETDGPVAFEALGGVQGPSLVPSVVFKLAELWRVSFEEGRESISRNGFRYLGVAGKG